MTYHDGGDTRQRSERGALGRVGDTIRSSPTLIIWGARYPFIPVRHARDAHAAIPSSRLVIFDDVGHYPHCEAPERFASVLLQFIDSTAPAHVSERQWRHLFEHPDQELSEQSPGPKV